MSPLKFLWPLLLLFLLRLYFPVYAWAAEDSQFITIVNPVRISSYTKNPKESLAAQYLVISASKLPATWLLTFDAIENDGIFSVLETMDAEQELGIFLEVTPSFAGASGVKYNDTDFWHHATSVFLSGYTQEERRLLIDTVFSKFKERFGVYPVSVGSWWTDAFSLSYMKEKYGITANLGLADQFSTDGYKVWGQYWSTPFYPSRYHAGVPASTDDAKLDLVTIQWAARDPLNGYKSSLYSTQDYALSIVGLTTDYFGKLIRLYTGRHKNSFGQITVGLEGDLDPESYRGEFANQMQLVRSLADSEEFNITNMEQFSKWYRQTFPKYSPTQIIETEDWLGRRLRVVWYNSTRFRVGLLHDYEKKTTKIFDLRSYHQDIQEPYYQSPNREFELSIYIPSYFDEIGNPDDIWLLNLGELKSSNSVDESLLLEFEEGRIIVSPNKFIIEGEDVETPAVLTESKTLETNLLDGYVEIVPKSNWIVGREGVVFRDLTDVATHELGRRKTIAIVGGYIAIFIFLGFLIRFSRLSDRKKFVLLTLIIVPPMVYSYFWYQKNSTNYYVSQGEIDALYHLSLLPSGTVVVYDKECLGCEWHTVLKPAVFANKRSYVRRYGKNPIVYNSKVFEAKSQKEAREEFEKLNEQYIYLSKYEDYIEKTPFSPGDLGIEKIYDNANAEIWRRKTGT